MIKTALWAFCDHQPHLAALEWIRLSKARAWKSSRVWTEAEMVNDKTCGWWPDCAPVSCRMFICLISDCPSLCDTQPCPSGYTQIYQSLYITPMPFSISISCICFVMDLPPWPFLAQFSSLNIALVLTTGRAVHKGRKVRGTSFHTIEETNSVLQTSYTDRQQSLQICTCISTKFRIWDKSKKYCK